ncbi:MAG: hypothetical protein PUB21_09360 [Bacteroidales bacterium]|nr:hypothetical protein [Bacteroidales bacterium]
MRQIIYFLFSLLLLVSCGKGSTDYKALKMENDSLRLENAKTTAELEDYLTLINEVEENFSSLRSAENYVSVEVAKGGELSKSSREKITDDMHLLSEVLAKNKEQIEKLKSQLQNGKIKSSQLQKTIDRLSMELDDKVTMISELQNQLAKRNIAIEALDEAVVSLSQDVATLAEETSTQKKVINIQDKELNKGYYCFGTTRELKDQKILSGRKVLPDGFNKNYFMEIDIRELKKIPLFAKKAKVLTPQPASSYEFIKDDEGKLTLKITDINAFWSIGKYLVIEVD